MTQSIESQSQGEEVKPIIEAIASTANFWHEWSKLRSILSFKLKQVLSEYPEAKLALEEQNALLGETYPDLVKRLDEALHNFDDGPPFTLQRFCEILLDARSVYPNLSKLALALEKNLSVTSTLTMSTEPYPPSVQKPDEPDESNEEIPKSSEGTTGQSESAENGVEAAAADRDEIMKDAVEADVDDTSTDMEGLEDAVESLETNSLPSPTTNS